MSSPAPEAAAPLGPDRLDGGDEPRRFVAVQRRLPGPVDPVRAARRWRGAHDLVCLIGRWAGGGALITHEPVARAGDLAALASTPDDVLAVADAAASLDDAAGFVGGGWFGVLGYQLGARLEQLPAPPHRPHPRPDLAMRHYPHVVRQDRSTGTWWFEALFPEELSDLVDVERRYDDVLARWATDPDPEPVTFSPFRMSPAPDVHRDVVRRGLDHIVAGDVFQVNLCVRLEATSTGDPLEAYLGAVTRLGPAWSAFVADDTDGADAVVSLSPELFLHRRGRSVVTSPIKGTAPLDADPRQLIGSAKDAAENVMIVDLMRNDLSRVAVAGTVRVPADPRVENHTGVWHLVRDVTATLREDVDDPALLAATFPPGSVTGAPKIRAMELINALETTGRETYTGAVGWLGPRGLELNVAIRTLEFHGADVWLGVGGGIVAASDPDAELRECLTKARPVLSAVGARLDDAVEPAPHRAPDPVSAAATPPAPLLADPRAGVFETVLVVDGVPRHLDRHLDRLADGVAAVGGVVPAGLRERVVRRAAATTGRSRMRVEVAAGQETESVLVVPTGPVPHALRLVPFQVAGGWGAHKWADRGALPEQDLDRSGRVHSELLLLDGDDVLETARGSVFFVDDDGVHTPELDGRILPGTARARVIETLTAAGIDVDEGRFTTQRLTTATEVFTTNAIRGVVPATVPWGTSRSSAPTRTMTISSWLQAALDHPPRPTVPRRAARSRVLLVDNYDSFVFNLARYCEELGAAPVVVRNDHASLRDPAGLEHRFDHVIVSPGPGRPADAGESVALVRSLTARLPILGICLGHQTIGEAFGGRTVAAPSVVHGTSSLVLHDGRDVFAGQPPLTGGRYHSLVSDETVLPAALVKTAWTPSGLLMGMRHRDHEVHGVQIHPESVLTSHGHDLIANFLRIGG